ncbi:MAG: methyltransferase [Parcubacteria group bacterium]|jgi:spermidine synthase
MEYIHIPIYSTGEKMKIKVKKIVENIKSEFQDISVVDTDIFGRCLVIDGVIQGTDDDSDIYDREMLKFLKRTDEKILILGGGDGSLAESILEKNPHAHIQIIDLDVEVINCCKKHFGQKIFDDPRVNLYIGDALHHMKSTIKKINGKFDGIICDLTDIPIGRKKKKDFVNFYEELIAISSKVLQKNGWMSIQAGASETNGYYLNMIKIVDGIAKKHFSRVSRSDVFIPSFGEKGAFLFIEKIAKKSLLRGFRAYRSPVRLTMKEKYATV